VDDRSGTAFEHRLGRLAGLLDEARRQRRTLTYLEAADALQLPGPARIHQLTRLLEALLERDAAAGRPLRSALVTSRATPGRPAAGFFEHARRLGLHDGRDGPGFHERLLEELFLDPGAPGAGSDGPVM